MKIRQILVAGLLLAMLPLVARAEQVDNPSYTAWTKHKAGTKVAYKAETSMAGMAMTMEMTMTLKEIKPDKAIVEYGMKMDMGGGMQGMPPRAQDVPAKIEKGQENLPTDMKGTTKDLGKETVEVLGKKYECSVRSFTGESTGGGRGGPPGKQTGKIWTAPEIPGGMVKMEMEMQMEQVGNGTMKMTLSALEEGK